MFYFVFYVFNEFFVDFFIIFADIKNHVFVKPEKQIKAMKDMSLWEKSVAYKVCNYNL